jgi:lambda repressor-like predicted transcriptional regulator
MHPAAILARLRAAGLRLDLDPAGRIRAGPRAALTPELRALIQTHRDALAEALDLEQDAAEFYEERAAILEHDAGLTREDAEAAAARLTVVRFRLHENKGGGSVIGHDCTAAEIIAELQTRYGARLAHVEPME